MPLYPGSGFYPDDYAYPGVPSDRSLRAFPEPDSTPPRIRIDVSDTTASPVSSLTITRTDADGRQWPVRTSDGGPLVVSGGIATVWDYEVPYGTSVTYSADAPNFNTVRTSLDVDRPWLIHVGVPTRSVTFTHGAGSAAEEDWDIDQGVFAVLGRSTPLVVTGGARQAPASQLVVLLSSDQERQALKLLLSDGAPLFLNVPSSLSWGIDTAYITVGKVALSRLAPVLTSGWRNVALPYQTVARPGGGTQAAITWETVASQYATWNDAAAAVHSWAELAAPTG